MIEFLLSFFIFVTWVIDLIMLIMKSADIRRRYASVFVISQMFGYVTRASVLFIMPAIGVILDGLVSFEKSFFLLFYLVFLTVFLLFIIFKVNAFKKYVKAIVYYFQYDIFVFFRVCLSAIFASSLSYRKINFKFNPLYTISSALLMCTFPALISFGLEYQGYRALILGSVSVYTGIFSIYVITVTERKVVGLPVLERGQYLSELIASKALASVIAFPLSIAVILYL